MRNLFFLLVTLILLQGTSANSVKNDLDRTDYYLYDLQNLDSAFIYTKNLLKRFEASGNTYRIVRSNLYLGYILELKQEYGKAVIYYLEGIRYSENAEFDKVIQNKIWLRRNIANIFRKFESNSLATKYNLEAIDLAMSNNIEDLIIRLKLNQGLVYQNNEQYTEAATMLKEILPLVTTDKVRESEIINQIGLVYLQMGDLESASYYFNQLLSLPEEASLYMAKALDNLGEISYKKDNLNEGIDYLKQAIDLMESNENPEEYGLFLSYKDIGLYLLQANKLAQSEDYLKKAELLFKYAESDPSSFEVFKILSDLYFNTNRPAEGNHYSQLYFNKVQSFIETQKEIQKQDKEYNFELITRRYFDNVDKQERIASILFISKLSSGSLLVLLLLVIVYYQMGKMRLRKSIENELRALKVLD